MTNNTNNLLNYAKALKNSILQQAIQGKLVEQRKEEGTAKELLEEIRNSNSLQNRGNLICNNKKKQKQLKPITEEEIPFEIPNSWEWVRLGEIINYNMGKTPPRNEDIYWKNGNYNWISIADMVENGFIEYTKEKVTQYSYDNIFKGNISKKGTLIMSFKLTVGRVSILNCDAFHNEAIISIYPIIDSNNIFRNYLFKILPYISTFGDTKSAIKGNTLNSESINNLLIPLPPLQEQKRIVEKIESIKPLFTEFEIFETRIKELTTTLPKQLKLSILQQAIQGKLVKQIESEGTAKELLEEIRNSNSLQNRGNLICNNKKKQKQLKPITEEEIPFEIPNSWEWVRLGEICNINGGYNFKSINLIKNYTNNDLVRIIRISDFNENGIKDIDKIYYKYDNVFEEFKLENNDIIIAMTGGTVGKNCLIKNIKLPTYVNQRVATIKPINNTIEYIYIYILCYKYKLYSIKNSRK